MTKPYSSHRFIANCFNAGNFKMEVKDFSKIAKSLTELTQKNKKYIWGEDQESAFQLLKHKLCEAPILALQEGNDDFVVYSDASHQDYDCEIRYHPRKVNVIADALSQKERIKLLRVRKQGKLNPRYIRPFKILDRIGTVAYKLELPEELKNVHITFYVSNLKKCLSNESLVIPMKELRLDDKLNFVEEPVEIMNREVKQLRQSRIPIVKVKEYQEKDKIESKPDKNEKRGKAGKSQKQL
uniref:Putative reverse transcriptase domain-containing protein n=1 Tax=Tanacetum cinerariifolium TaxID=118510 RepID=A0A699HN47_TANCI|nr:putative reverse transcriptase domain-containing protein [Tanacetum cinerariifolium]